MSQESGGRAKRIDLLGLNVPCTGQPTPDLALVLKDIEMPPHHLFGVVIAGRFGTFIRAALHLP